MTKGGTGENTDVNRQLVYLEYDNLDQVSAIEQYDADTLSITSSGGVPSKPSSSLRRDLSGQTTKVIEAYADGIPSDADNRTTLYAYDGQGLSSTSAPRPLATCYSAWTSRDGANRTYPPHLCGAECSV